MKLVVMLMSVLNGFVFLGQLLKANEITKSLVNVVYFVSKIAYVKFLLEQC